MRAHTKQSIIHEHMGLRPPLQLEDMERSHRLGSRFKQNGGPCQHDVIVQFRSLRKRDDVLKARRVLQTHNDRVQSTAERIYVYEDLTPLSFIKPAIQITQITESTKYI